MIPLIFNLLTKVLPFLKTSKQKATSNTSLMTLLIIGLIFAYFQMQKLSNQLNKVNLNPEVKTEVIQDTVLVNKLLKELEGLKTKLTSTKITIPVETVTTNIPIPIEEKDTTYSIYQKPYKISANYLWASRQLKLEVIRDSLII